MQGATHRAGGVTACLLSHYLNVRTGAPVDPGVALLVQYPFALWGSTANDLDHHPGSIWDEVKLVGERSGHTLPSQDPVSRTLSHLLHLTKPLRGMFPARSTMAHLVSVLDCKHRSWQTHSEFPILLLMLSYWSVSSAGVQTVDGYILQLVIAGLLMGMIAHLVLDLLTPEGLPFATGLFVNRVVLKKKVLPEKIKIIPHVKPTPEEKRQGLPGFFSTGGKWEKKIVFNVLHFINLLLLLLIVMNYFNISFPSLKV